MPDCSSSPLDGRLVVFKLGGVRVAAPAEPGLERLIVPNTPPRLIKLSSALTVGALAAALV